MSRKYARGRNAVAECQRSGQKMKYRDLVEDGHVPGLLVHPDWWEPKHPQEIPVTVDDPIALHRPAPEISIEPGYGDPENLDAGETPADIYEASVIYDNFNRDPGSPGPLWTGEISPTFFVPLFEIVAGGLVEDQVINDIRQTGEALHQTLLPQDQYSMVETVNFRRDLPLGNSPSVYLYVRTTRENSGNGYYLYVWGDAVVENDLHATWGKITNGAISFHNSNDFVIPGGIPDGMRIRVEAIGDTLYSYYDLGAGAGWQQLVSPFVDANWTTAPSPSHAGFGVEGWTQDTAWSVDSFWAGPVGQTTTGILGSLNGAVSILDDFNRAGPGLGPDWNDSLYVGAGGLDFTIVSNQLVADPTGYASASYIAQPFEEDCFAEFDIIGIPSATEYWEALIYLRTDDPEPNRAIAISVWGDSGTGVLGAYVSFNDGDGWVAFPNQYPLSFNASVIAATATFRVEITGNTITGYLDGRVLDSITDSRFAGISGGGVLIQHWRDTNTMPLDNFRAGSLGTSGASLIGGESRHRDEFNRPGPALGSDWDVGIYENTGMQIVGGNHIEVAATDERNNLYVGAEITPNQYAEVEVLSYTYNQFNTYVELVLRGDGTAKTGYGLALSISNAFVTTGQLDVEVWRATGPAFAGEWIYVDGFDHGDGLTIPPGTILRFQIVDDVLSGYYNGREMFSFTDSTYSTGFPGCGAWSYVTASEVQIDNFRVGNVARDIEPFRHAFTTTLEYNLTGGERSVALSEAVTHKFNQWLFIDLDDGTQFITRIATESLSPTFILPLTTAFPSGKIASAGNTITIGDAR